MRLILVRVYLLGLLGVLVCERPENVVLDHLHRGLQDRLNVKRIVGLRFVQDVYKLDQALALLFPVLHFVRLFLHFSLEIGRFIAKQ